MAPAVRGLIILYSVDFLSIVPKWRVTPRHMDFWKGQPVHPDLIFDEDRQKLRRFDRAVDKETGLAIGQRAIFGMITMLPLKSAKGGRWRVDIYNVHDRRRVIGRIMRTHIAGWPWFWAITAQRKQRCDDRGYATSREDAIEQLRRRSELIQQAKK